MNKIAQKFLIALAFSVLLLGGTNASFATHNLRHECYHRVHNNSGLTLKLDIGLAGSDLRIKTRKSSELAGRKALDIPKYFFGDTVKIRVVSGRYAAYSKDNWIKFTLYPNRKHKHFGCGRWKETSHKNADLDYPIFMQLNTPADGQISIVCKSTHWRDGKCE